MRSSRMHMFHGPPAAMERFRMSFMSSKPPDPRLAAGRAIRSSMPVIISAVVARFRSELPPLGAPGIDTMHDLVLADHTTTWISEVATELLVAGANVGRGDHLLSDGRQVYLLLAELHGRQRARHDWPEAALAREYVILREEMARVVPAEGENAGHAGSGELYPTIDRITSESHQYALAALRRGQDAPVEIEE